MTHKDLPKLEAQVQRIRSQIAPDGVTGESMA